MEQFPIKYMGKCPEEFLTLTAILQESPANFLPESLIECLEKFLTEYMMEFMKFLMDTDKFLKNVSKIFKRPPDEFCEKSPQNYCRNHRRAFGKYLCEIL